MKDHKHRVELPTRCNRGFYCRSYCRSIAWPTDQAIHYKKPTKNTLTQPPLHSKHLTTNPD